MNIKASTGIFATVIGLSFLSACSSLPDQPLGPKGYTIVARNKSSEPAWVSDPGTFENRKKNKSDYWFVAMSPMENSLRGAKRDAYTRALRKASDQIGNQSWDIVGEKVKKKLNESTQNMDRVHDRVISQLRQASVGWLTGGQEYAYYWMQYQTKKDHVAPHGEHSLYRAWVLVRFDGKAWECSRKNSLKMLPVVLSDLGGKFGYKDFNPLTFQKTVEMVANKNMSLIPDSVCSGEE